MLVSSSTSTIQSIKDAWFEEFIAAIRTHQVLLETNTAPESVVKLYNAAMSGDHNNLAELNKINANQHFIKQMIFEYLQQVANRLPIKLAFDLDDSEVLVWAEISDDDEEMENFLLLVEATVNAKYHKFGYDFTSTIVEVRDRLSIPNHYTPYKN